MYVRFCRIEVEMHKMYVSASLMPFVIFVSGRHERELPGEVSELGRRQSLDEGLSIAAPALLISHKQMHRSMKATLHSILSRKLQGFCRHAMPRHGASPPDIRRRNLDTGTDYVICGVTMRPTNWIAIGHLGHLQRPRLVALQMPCTVRTFAAEKKQAHYNVLSDFTQKCFVTLVGAGHVRDGQQPPHIDAPRSQARVFLGIQHLTGAICSTCEVQGKAKSDGCALKLEISSV
jgi:hypothetical protein